MLALTAILAAVHFGQWGLVDIAIAIVIIAAVVALVYVALRQFGISVPGWVTNVFWIVVIAFVVIFAIRLVAAM